jgi:hypothetical protein
VSVLAFGKGTWLPALLADVVAAHAHASEPVLEPALLPMASGRARGRAFLRRTLRASGLVYGTPVPLPSSVDGGEPPDVPARAVEDALFHAVVGTLARMALDLARVMDAPPGPRTEQLLVLFAVLAGDLDLAQALDARLQAGLPVPRRMVGRVEDALDKRAPSLAGDPVYGLVLHNGAQYADAQLFCRLAIELFASGRLSREVAERRRDFAAKQKALLVDVLTALACVDREPRAPTRRAILRQVEGLKLPHALESEVKAAVRQSFERKRDVRDVVRRVRSVDMRHLLLEQALLAALADGRRTRRERTFIDTLAEALRVPRAELRRLELEMAEFYARHRPQVDAFTVSDAAGAMGEELMSGMQETLERNYHRLLQEARETGDLAVLLAKAARRQKLTDDERQRMRAQLIDVAKAIPALAIFAAPGGILLLAALAKVLPFSLLPSAFQDAPAHDPDEDTAEREAR